MREELIYEGNKYHILSLEYTVVITMSFLSV